MERSPARTTATSGDARGGWRRTGFILGACLAISPLHARSADASSAVPIMAQCSDGGLTVEAHQAVLRTVLVALGRWTGMAVSGEIDEDQQIDASFRCVSMVVALRRLLGTDGNFVLEYDDHGRPARLTILSPASDGGVRRARAPMRGDDPSGADQANEAPPRTQIPSFAAQRGEPASAMSSPDASPDMRRLAQALIRLNDPREFADSVREVFGEDAPTIAAKIANESTSPELRGLAIAAGPMLGGLPDVPADDGDTEDGPQDGEQPDAPGP